MKNTLTVGSLFAGIGGFDLGFERAGFEIKWQVEIDPFCRAVLEKHWPHVRRYEDVRTVGAELDRTDVICGGFPCQPASRGGHRLGVDDERWLWPEFIRIVRLLRPRGVVLENVADLLSVNDGAAFGEILGDLAACGYDAEWDCLSGAAFGAPTLRDRLWLFAYPRQEHRHAAIFSRRDADAFARCADVLPEGNDWQATIRREDRELVEMVPGIHSRVAEDWWLAQSRMARSAHGVPDQLERCGAIGNSIYPQIAQWIAERIKEAEALT